MMAKILKVIVLNAILSNTAKILKVIVLNAILSNTAKILKVIVLVAYLSYIGQNSQPKQRPKKACSNADSPESLLLLPECRDLDNGTCQS